MNDINNSTGNFRWLLIPSCMAFLVLAVQQSYVVMMHTPRMLELYSGFGAGLPARTQFAADWYWLGCALATGLTLVATFLVVVNKKKGNHTSLKRWYLAAVAGAVGAMVWAAFVVSAMYEPVFEMGSTI